MKTKYLPFVISFIIILLDQVSKFWIKLNFAIGDEIVIFDWFRIHFLENEGMAFGMQLGGSWGKPLLTLFRLVAASFLCYYIVYLIKKKESKFLIISMSLIMAGAVGNIIDSLFYGLIFSESYFHVAQFMPEAGGYAPFLYGKVVDLFYFPIIDTTWPSWVPVLGGESFQFFRPVFNVADSAISVGVVLFLIVQRKQIFFKEATKKS